MFDFVDACEVTLARADAVVAPDIDIDDLLAMLPDPELIPEPDPAPPPAPITKPSRPLS